MLGAIPPLVCGAYSKSRVLLVIISGITIFAVSALGRGMYTVLDVAVVIVATFIAWPEPEKKAAPEPRFTPVIPLHKTDPVPIRKLTVPMSSPAAGIGHGGGIYGSSAPLAPAKHFDVSESLTRDRSVSWVGLLSFCVIVATAIYIAVGTMTSNAATPAPSTKAPPSTPPAHAAVKPAPVKTPASAPARRMPKSTQADATRPDRSPASSVVEKAPSETASGGSNACLKLSDDEKMRQCLEATR